jgi:hypothetical protein
MTGMPDIYVEQSLLPRTAKQGLLDDFHSSNKHNLAEARLRVRDFCILLLFAAISTSRKTDPSKA